MVGHDADVFEKDGKVVEDTFDWYAQDEDGNVWYFGEISLKGNGATSTSNASKVTIGFLVGC